jgi:hypothetical protein
MALYGLTDRDRSAIRDAIAFTKQARRGGMLDRRDPIFAPPFSVIFKNDSGEAIPPFAVMAVTAAELDGTTYICKVQKPSTTFRRQYLVNGPDEVPYHSIRGYGEAQQGQVVRVFYDTGTPANGEGWGPKPGQWSLSKNYPQTAIAQGVVDSDNKIMLAHWGPIQSGMGQATAAVTAGATGTIRVLQGTLPGSVITHSAVDMEIDCVCPMELAEDDYCVFGYYNGQLAAFPWDCGE